MIDYNPYFSGNSFAIPHRKVTVDALMSHNPYFSGNSFAITWPSEHKKLVKKSQSLF